jgi:uncharacterized OB-fold protein
MTSMIQPEAEWRAHLAEGRFMLQRSRSTGRHIFYPRIVEPGSGADDLDWVEASGRATVHAVTVVRRKDPADSYNVVLVDLAEGPRLMSRVDGVDPDAVRIGMDVRAHIVREGEAPLLVFVPA